MSVSMSLVDTGGTGNYTNLTTWESTEQTNLTVGEGCIHTVYCKSSNGSADALDVYISGWTTAAGNYIKIACTGSDKHNGFWDDTKYRLQTDGSNGATVYINVGGNVRIDGIQISKSATGYHDSAIEFRDSSGESGINSVSNAIIRGTTATSQYSDGIQGYSDGSGKTYYIYNNILYNWRGTDCGGIAVWTSNPFYIYNNTIISCSTGILSSAGYSNVVVSKNNLCYGNTNDYVGTFSTYSANNISKDNTAPGSYAYSGSTTVLFINSASCDFRLSPYDYSASMRGTSLVADTYLSFSTDIAGTSRGTINWDIGAFHVTESARIVDTGGTGHYTNLSIWESGEQTNLTASNKIAIAECRATNGAADTAGTTINGWDTSATNYIKIYTSGSNRHSGIWNTNKYRISITDDSCMAILDDYVKVIGIQMETSSPTGNGRNNVYISSQGVSNEIWLESLICKHHNDTTYWGRSITAEENDNINLKVFNSILYNMNSALNNNNNRQINFGGTSAKIYNCTVIGGFYGVRRTSGTATCKNIIVQNTMGENYLGISDDSINNISNDNTAPGSYAYSGSMVQFQDSGSGDFRLSSTDTAAKDKGADLSNDAYISFTTDIAGRSRPIGASWDIGAYEADEYTATTNRILFRGLGARIKIRF